MKKNLFILFNLCYFLNINGMEETTTLETTLEMNIKIPPFVKDNNLNDVYITAFKKACAQSKHTDYTTFQKLTQELSNSTTNENEKKAIQVARFSGNFFERNKVLQAFEIIDHPFILDTSGREIARNRTAYDVSVYLMESYKKLAEEYITQLQKK